MLESPNRILRRLVSPLIALYMAMIGLYIISFSSLTLLDSASEIGKIARAGNVSFGNATVLAGLGLGDSKWANLTSTDPEIYNATNATVNDDVFGSTTPQEAHTQKQIDFIYQVWFNLCLSFFLIRPAFICVQFVLLPIFASRYAGIDRYLGTFTQALTGLFAVVAGGAFHLRNAVEFQSVPFYDTIEYLRGNSLAVSTRVAMELEKFGFTFSFRFLDLGGRGGGRGGRRGGGDRSGGGGEDAEEAKGSTQRERWMRRQQLTKRHGTISSQRKNLSMAHSTAWKESADGDIAPYHFLPLGSGLRIAFAVGDFDSAVYAHAMHGRRKGGGGGGDDDDDEAVVTVMAEGQDSIDMNVAALEIQRPTSALPTHQPSSLQDIEAVKAKKWKVAHSAAVVVQCTWRSYRADLRLEEERANSALTASMALDTFTALQHSVVAVEMAASVIQATWRAERMNRLYWRNRAEHALSRFISCPLALYRAQRGTSLLQAEIGRRATWKIIRSRRSDLPTRSDAVNANPSILVGDLRVVTIRPMSTQRRLVQLARKVAKMKQDRRPRVDDVRGGGAAPSIEAKEAKEVMEAEEALKEAAAKEEEAAVAEKRRLADLKAAAKAAAKADLKAAAAKAAAKAAAIAKAEAEAEAKKRLADNMDIQSKLADEVQRSLDLREKKRKEAAKMAGMDALQLCSYEIRKEKRAKAEKAKAEAVAEAAARALISDIALEETHDSSDSDDDDSKGDADDIASGAFDASVASGAFGAPSASSASGASAHQHLAAGRSGARPGRRPTLMALNSVRSPGSGLHSRAGSDHGNFNLIQSVDVVIEWHVPYTARRVFANEVIVIYRVGKLDGEYHLGGGAHQNAGGAGDTSVLDSVLGSRADSVFGGASGASGVEKAGKMGGRRLSLQKKNKMAPGIGISSSKRHVGSSRSFRQTQQRVGGVGGVGGCVIGAGGSRRARGDSGAHHNIIRGHTNLEGGWNAREWVSADLVAHKEDEGDAAGNGAVDKGTRLEYPTRFLQYVCHAYPQTMVTGTTTVTLPWATLSPGEKLCVRYMDMERNAVLGESLIFYAVEETVERPMASFGAE